MGEKGRAYEFFEIATSGLKMSAKMHAYVFMGCFFLHMLVFVMIVAATWSNNRLNSLTFVVAKIASLTWPDKAVTLAVFDDQNRRTKLHVRTILKNYAGSAKKQGVIVAVLFVLSGAVYVAYPFMINLFKQKAREKTGREHVRGSRQINIDEFNRQFKQNGEQPGYHLGDIRMPKRAHNRGTAIAGISGSGKTTCVKPVLYDMKKNKEKAIVYDYKGDLVSEFYDPRTDYIFNVVDERCVKWSVFNEIKTLTDIEALAWSNVPDRPNSNPFWEAGVRNILAGGLLYNYFNGKKTNQHIWDFICTPNKKMIEMLGSVKGTEPALKTLGECKGDSRQADGLHAVMMQYCRCYDYLTRLEGGFSIKDWVENGEGFIFVTNYEDISFVLRPILSLFIDLAIQKLLSLPDSDGRIVNFVFDEFGTLQRLNIPRLIRGGRSKGSQLFLCFQDRQQLLDVYGDKETKSMENNLANRLVFRLTGDDAKYESQVMIKNTEYIKYERAYSMGPDDHSDRMNMSPRKYVEPLFLDSDIARLKDLTAIVKIADYDYLISAWPYRPPAVNHPPLVFRKDLTLDAVVGDQHRMAQDLEDADISYGPGFIQN